MIKNIKIAHLKLNLRRSPFMILRNNGPIWEVLNEDKTIRKGILYKRQTLALVKKFGWEQHKEQYWVLELFWQHKVLVAPTRTALLGKLYELEHPNEHHILLTKEDA